MDVFNITELTSRCYVRGDIVTSKKADMSHLYVKNFKDITWFRPRDYIHVSDSYGPFTGFYYVNSTLNLIDLGSTRTRYQLQLLMPEVSYDADSQYEGANSNLLLHTMIMTCPDLSHFDGTIIDSISDDDLKGAEEVVLFRRSYAKIGLLHIK